MSNFRKWMLALGSGIVLYVVWTSFLVEFSLIAESGGKDSKPWLAAGALWPPIELIVTWIWAHRHQDLYSASKHRQLGNALLLLVIIVSAPLTMLLAMAINWQWAVIIPGLITIIGCWTTRSLWSMPKESYSLGINAKE